MVGTTSLRLRSTRFRDDFCMEHCVRGASPRVSFDGSEPHLPISCALHTCALSLSTRMPSVQLPGGVFVNESLLDVLLLESGIHVLNDEGVEGVLVRGPRPRFTALLALEIIRVVAFVISWSHHREEVFG